MISPTSHHAAARFRMGLRLALALSAFLLLMLAGAPMPARAADGAFRGFLELLWPRAAARGVSRATFTQVFADLTEDPSVPVAVAKQPEFERLLSAYFTAAVSPTRIARGRVLAAAYRGALETIVRRYGVPAGILLAAWGMESDFGRDRGRKDVVRSLATLAFHRRDNNLFTDELISALVILEQRRVPRSRLVGSWAGAMGDPQFMPSAYLKYAVAFHGIDHDGFGSNRFKTMNVIDFIISSGI